MGNMKTAFSKNVKQYMMLITLIIIILAFQFMTGQKLLQPMNVSNLINQNAYVVILAVGMLICILTGGNIDLSVGSVVGLIGAIAASITIKPYQINPYLGIVICLLVGIIIGVWQGFWIAYVRIPAFIVTLSGQLVFRGATLLILNGLTISGFPREYAALSTGFIPDPLSGLIPGVALNLTCVLAGIVISIVYIVMQLKKRIDRKRKGYTVEGMVNTIIRCLLICAAVIWFFVTVAQYKGIPVVLISVGIVLLAYSYITSKTVMGRHIYAIGGNEKAARLSGVKTNKMMFLAYVNMAFLAAVAGIVFSARLDSGSPQAGIGYELDAIGACFIGGASAYGGIGTVGGTLIGALIMGILNNGMSIAGISINTQQVVKGLVLLAAVAFDVISKQKITLPFFTKIFHRNKPGTTIGI